MSKERKKNKILFISSWYPNRLNPSFGVFIKRHAESVALFQTVAVIYVQADPDMKSGNFETTVSVENKVFSVIVYYKKNHSSFPVISQLAKIYRYLKAHFIAYGKVREKMGKPELLHLNVIYKAGLITLLFSKFYNIPFVTSEHWSGYMPEDNSYRGFFKKWITRRVVKNSKAVLVVSKNMMENMLKHKLYNSYFIVPNVVDSQLFKPLMQSRNKNDKIRIIHVSSITDREKNISGILKTVKNLTSIRNDFELEIVGNSSEKSFFEKTAMEMGLLNKHVFFRGWKNPVETASLLRHSDFFLLFSNYESFSCVLIEALASGIPVIATKTGGIPEFINKEQGILVPVSDEKRLLKSLEFMLDKYTTYPSGDLNKYATENFSYPVVGEKIAAIYAQLIKDFKTDK